MESRVLKPLGPVLGWLVFPLVPVVLEDFYYQTCNLGGPDPHDWNWFLWMIMLGPLSGYSFLAGATIDLPDDPGALASGWRRFLARRAVWMAIGPWWGFLIWIGVYLGYSFLWEHLPALRTQGLPQWWNSVVGWEFRRAWSMRDDRHQRTLLIPDRPP